LQAMELEALLGQLGWERRRMRSVAVAALNRLVWNEPGVAAAPDAIGRAAPARDVRRVLVGDAEREPVEARRAVARQVEHELVAIVQEAVAVDRLVVADREVARQAGGEAGRLALDGDRLDPMNDVLQP